jgi:hypothetical protein
MNEDFFHVTQKIGKYFTCEYRNRGQVFFTTIPHVFMEAHHIFKNDYFLAEMDEYGGIILETISKVQ